MMEHSTLKACALIVLVLLATVSTGVLTAEAGDAPAKQESLPEAAKDVDEFYARVDEIVSPTELMVTVLDVWNPLDKARGPRWPGGKARVKPARRAVVLEEIAAPDNADDKKQAMDLLRKAIDESGGEVICSGSGVAVKKLAGGEVICVTGYITVKKGFSLNNMLVRQGLATTTNPFYQPWQEEAKRKGLGMWRAKK
jgi:hypothetical protein